MTVFPFRRLVARPLRRAAAIRHRGTARRPERRTYRDSFFADPAVVEDDYLRLRRRSTSGR